MSTARFGRGHKAMAIVPLAVLSAAWTASIAGIGGITAVSADASPETTLPDGSSVPTAAIEAPASVSGGGDLNGGIAPGLRGNPQTVASRVTTSGIPAAALAAYQRAETVINSADRSCNLSWQLIAAIGKVESDHGRVNGNSLDRLGVARPGIYGIALDGNHGTTRISDTDAGQYDSDATYDRAIGPMQFIPSTWSVVGVDADGDGKRNPQDVDDAALGTAVYLCSGADDLSEVPGQRAAIFRYNHSTQYVDLVVSIMNAYLDGEFTSVPNGTTSAGYLLPAEPVEQPSHQGNNNGHHGNNNGGGNNGGNNGGGQPTEEPSEQPTEEPSEQPTNPTNPGGGGHLPTPSLPPLPSTSIPPLDALLTHAQAVVQCTLEGYIDNILRSDDPFDKCVYAYTHR
ncbi:lytic murein transglycosylase [Nocardioides sp. SR21]|uniref:lytic murein transglycosylase n=1 Tax=Nocardioides sp. SR21 TaxID=2919501 RepID=UPI001FAA91AA|nr:lytic murein transglycosylase [Nocardioides sp. SR21]